MSEDPFQILADELTLIRKGMDHLQRTSLNKDEATTLNKAVMQAASRMAKATKDAPGEIQHALKTDHDQMVRSATQAATRAAESAISDIRNDLSTERAMLSQAAGEVRREVWRSFGGSGCGWPPCSPQGRLSGRWQRFGLLAAGMPTSSHSIHASIVASQADRSSNRTTDRAIARFGLTGLVSDNQADHDLALMIDNPEMMAPHRNEAADPRFTFEGTAMSESLVNKCCMSSA